jgi:hypothetical protein
MRLFVYLIGFATAIVLGVYSLRGAGDHCDCIIFPFQPDPPCFDRCVAKHLAIASTNDLKTIFGFPDDVAKTIANIPPPQRPRSLEDYRRILSGPVYEAFQKNLRTLTAANFAQVRHDASVLAGYSIDKLGW